MDFHAGRSMRIRTREEISRMFDLGARAGGPSVMIIGMENPDSRPRARTGVAVAKKLGTAVVRNRAKRLCREAARLVRNDLPGGWDFLIVPRAGAELNLTDLMADIKNQTGKIVAKAKPQPEAESK